MSKLESMRDILELKKDKPCCLSFRRSTGRHFISGNLYYSEQYPERSHITVFESVTVDADDLEGEEEETCSLKSVFEDMGYEPDKINWSLEVDYGGDIDAKFNWANCLDHLRCVDRGASYRFEELSCDSKLRVQGILRIDYYPETRQYNCSQDVTYYGDWDAMMQKIKDVFGKYKYDVFDIGFRELGE